MSNQQTGEAYLPTPLDDQTLLLLQEGLAWLYNANPFWAALASSPSLRIGYVPPALEGKITTAATDGYTTIWLCPKFLRGELFAKADAHNDSRAGALLYVVLHELAHILADHVSPRIVNYMTEPKIRNVAVDYQVFDVLARDGFMPPALFEGCPIDKVFDRSRRTNSGKFGFYGDAQMRSHCADADDAVRIYDYLVQSSDQQSQQSQQSQSAGEGTSNLSGDVQPEHSPGGADNQQNGVPSSPSSPSSPSLPSQGDVPASGPGSTPLDQARDEMIANAVIMAKTIGKLSVAGQRAANALTKSKTPWQRRLANLMGASTARAQERRRTYRRISRRTMPTRSPYAIKPGRIRHPKPGVLLVADCSGSVSHDELRKFAAECEAILASGKVGYIRVIYCDTKVTDNRETFKGRAKVTLKPTTTGGTDFEPVWHWQRKNEPDVAAIIYLTDLYGSFGPKETWPKVPVIWGLTTRQHPPFGKAVYIGVE